MSIPGTTASILIVDDEIDLVRLVSYNLEKEGFQVFKAYDGESALRCTRQHRPDLVILDLMLPDMFGVQVCEKIKNNEETKTIPVIMLTARSSEHDRISGFESGAEDYVVKPFSPKELVLRVKAMLSRTRGGEVKKTQSVRLGTLTIYPEDFLVEGEDGVPLTLTNLEFRILLTLAQSANRVKTREQLIADVWGQEGDDISDRTVDTHIKRLRIKLGENREMIETIRGVGYRVMAAKAML